MTEQFDLPAFEPAGFVRDASGMVSLFGAIGGGTLGSAVFTLPEGYRPLKTLVLEVEAPPGTAHPGRLKVTSRGEVIPLQGSTKPFLLNGARFPAAQVPGKGVLFSPQAKIAKA